MVSLFKKFLQYLGFKNLIIMNIITFLTSRWGCALMGCVYFKVSKRFARIYVKNLATLILDLALPDLVIIRISLFFQGFETEFFDNSVSICRKSEDLFLI